MTRKASTSARRSRTCSSSRTPPAPRSSLPKLRSSRSCPAPSRRVTTLARARSSRASAGAPFAARSRTAKPAASTRCLPWAATRSASRLASGSCSKRRLQAPSFLYHVDESSGSDDTGLHKVAAFALANRLAYFVWGSAPDEALLAAAESGELDSAAGVATQVERMLSERPEAAVRGFRDFSRQWLELDALDALNRDLTRYPMFTSETGPLLRESLSRQVDEAVWQSDNSVEGLLLGHEAFVSAPIAELFGVSAADDTFVKVSLDPTRAQRHSHAPCAAERARQAQPDRTGAARQVRARAAAVSEALAAARRRGDHAARSRTRPHDARALRASTRPSMRAARAATS